jgi:hypothetical protein
MEEKKIQDSFHFSTENYLKQHLNQDKNESLLNLITKQNLSLDQIE